MRSTILRRFLCTFVITAGCASGEMHRAAGDGEGGPGDGGADEDGSSSDPSGTPGTSDDGAEDPSAPGDSSDSDPSNTDPTVGDSSDSDPSDTDPSDSDPTDTDSDPTDTDPSDSSGGEEESTGDPTDATTTDATTTDTDPSETDSDTAVAEPVDLSGYTVMQTNSFREYVIPDGTIVPRGGYLVIARSASPGAFQDFWGVNWGDDVVYIDTDDAFPTINGAETFSLYDTSDVLVDGPTPLLDLATGATRLDPTMDASDPTAWEVNETPNASASPGAGGPEGGASGAPFLSEYVDPTGAGNFAYEFVEVRVAP